ncbi:hypothetical protein FDA94_01670 [Herbidospora galbida]|uniref:Uncharacterized protein n=1 Tax=Herbidospora galbida TaxID=2575442 RepID=A0A4U3MT43_9ACTN|nr:hypothetical protein FDA94_01670 [Herbidospora galbida]
MRRRRRARRSSSSSWSTRGGWAPSAPPRLRDVVNAFAALDVARMWSDGSVAAVDGSQIETWIRE